VRRVRGYHFHHSGPTAKKNNPSPFRKLPDTAPVLNDGVEKLAEDNALPSPHIDGKDLEAIGFARQMG